MQVCSNFIVLFSLASNKRPILPKYVHHLLNVTYVGYPEVLLKNAVLNQRRSLIENLQEPFKRDTHLGFNAIKMLKKISLALLTQLET